MKTKVGQLFVTQHDYRVDEHSAARRNVGRQERNGDEQGSNGGKRQRIVRRHAKQQARHQLRQSQSVAIPMRDAHEAILAPCLRTICSTSPR